MLSDGWYRVTFQGGPYAEVWHVVDGKVGGVSVEDGRKLGFMFEPVVVLTKDEYEQLLREKGAANQHD